MVKLRLSGRVKVRQRKAVVVKMLNIRRMALLTAEREEVVLANSRRFGKRRVDNVIEPQQKACRYDEKHGVLCCELLFVV